VNWRVLILPNAEADLRDAQLWYNSQRSGLGEEFLNEIGRAVVFLGKKPERHPIYYNGFRRLLTHRFPYKLFYRIQSNQVIVFRVLHAKRDHDDTSDGTTASRCLIDSQAEGPCVLFPIGRIPPGVRWSTIHDRRRNRRS
jgi:plasmid stabilization system protein ParE